MSFSQNSQTIYKQPINLTPILQKINNDTLFCFSINQSKELARRIEKGFHCETKINALQGVAFLQKQIIETKDKIIVTLHQKIENSQLIIENKNLETRKLNTIIKVQNSKLKKGRTHKILMGVGIGIVSLLAISN